MSEGRNANARIGSAPGTAGHRYAQVAADAGASSAIQSWLRWRVAAVYAVTLVSLVIAHPTPGSLLEGALITVAGLVFRAWAAGHLRKGEALARGGPYARTRNPLYLGSTLLWAGFAVATRSWIVGAMFLVYFFAFYPAAMKGESSAMRAAYGEAFGEYERRVPLFWPRLRAARTAPVARFSLARYLRNKEYQAAIVAVVCFAILWALNLWRS